MNYFVFGGIDSRTYGIKIESMPPLQRGKKRVQQITIPDRAGTLTIPESDEAYEPYIQGIPISVPEDSWQRVQRWLSGSGNLTLCNDPDKVQAATVINAMNFQRVSKFVKYYKGQVQFYCQPLKLDKAIKLEELSTHQTIVNMGDVGEKPKITIYGSGDMTITAGGTQLAISNVQDGCIIDCDACEVLSLDETKLLTANSKGSFPVLPMGRSTFDVEGGIITRITAERKERYL